MAKHHQVVESKQKLKKRTKAKSVAAEPVHGQTGPVGQVGLSQELIGTVDGGAIQAQAARLGDTRLQTAQRQALAAQIGQVQGNHQLAAILSPLGGNFKVVQPQEVEPLPAEGNPVAPPLAGTSIHPTVRQGSTGPAVEELQQKLNADGATPALVVDGIFGPLTRAATVAFQQKYGLSPDGIAGPITWGKMDELGLASTVGRVERTWEEEVGGQVYGMTSRYTWRITQTEIRITVRLRFTGVQNPGLVASMFDTIRNIWNRFKVVNTVTGESLNIVFDPQSVSGEADNVVRLRPGNGRSDAANWYIGDPDLGETAAHEFGHMVGLEDEYQRTHRDYTRLVGEEPGEGETENEADPADVAEELHDALRVDPVEDRVTEANDVISDHGLVQGDYAQQVATAYQTAYGINIVDDIVARIPDEDEWNIVDPFTYSSGSIMGMGTDHEHPVEPRHVREFVGYVQAAKGGTWQAEPI